MFAGLAAEKYDRQYSDRVLLRRMLGYFAPHRARMVRLILTVSLITLIGLSVPLLTSRALDVVVAQPSVVVIVALCSSLLGLMTLGWLANRSRRRLIARLVADVIGQMRLDAFNATIHHDLAFFDEFQSGRVIARITNDTQELSQVTVLLSDMVNQFLVVVVLWVVLLTVSPPLALALLAIMPFLALTGWAFRVLARKVTRQGFRAIADVNAAIQEAVSGIRVAKAFRQERNIYAQFSQVNQRSYRVNLWRGFVLSNVIPTMNLLSGVGTAIITYLGGRAVVGGSISLGEWYLFIVSLDSFWFPMTNLASFWSQIQNGLSACERIFALIDARSNVRQAATPIVLNHRLRGAITFDRVHFRYNDRQEVLRDFSLRIAPGESVALVGHTGAGKSSIIKLIARFYEFQGGCICVDDYDIRSLDLHSYRRQIGLVPQTPFLFDDTVLNNIRYANPSLSDAEVESIARRIGDGEWIASLPQGLHTRVGSRGQHLSMGQRQLVALARVLAQRPAIFILDEATASIDPFTERQIQAALDLILASSTAVLIAHRLSTVRTADRIIVLERGQIIEEGNHDQLMRQGGHYAVLYDTYFRHQVASFNEETFRQIKAGIALE